MSTDLRRLFENISNSKDRNETQYFICFCTVQALLKGLDQLSHKINEWVRDQMLKLLFCLYYNLREFDALHLQEAFYQFLFLKISSLDLHVIYVSKNGKEDVHMEILVICIFSERLISDSYHKK